MPLATVTLLPLDIVATHILPNLSTHSLLQLLASGRSLHAGIRIALTHNNFSLSSTSPSLSHVVAQLGALRRILRTHPTNHTTVVLLSYYPSLEQPPPPPATYLEPVVIDFSGMKLCSTATSPPLLHHRIHVSRGATNVVISGLAIVNTRNKNTSSSTTTTSSSKHTSFTHLSGVTIADAGTSVRINQCTVSNSATDCGGSGDDDDDTFRQQAHGLIATNGATVLLENCQFHNNGKSGVFVRDPGTVVTIVNGDLFNNQDYGVQVERAGVVTLLGKTKVHHNDWYGLGCYGRGSMITLGTMDVVVAENTNDSYGSKYGYAKEGGLIQLLCDDKITDEASGEKVPAVVADRTEELASYQKMLDASSKKR